jgi:hypothetical protein
MSTRETEGHSMNSMYEDLARAHSRERLRQAREARRANHLARALRLARRAERTAYAAKLHLARAF